MSGESEVACTIEGHAGVIRLDRPKALNALTLGMVRAMAQALDAWERDARVERIVVESTSEKAFCAGGDIRSLHDLGKAGRHDEMLAFWGEEYVLNHRIKHYPKPYVALVDGIVMGGGVGISLHGSHRVAGGRYLFAMPEVGIGFFPDVGATHALPRLPHHAGAWLAITGDRIGAGDAVALGLATDFVPSEAMAGLSAALRESGDTDAIIARFSTTPPAAASEAHLETIEACFGADTVEGLVEALQERARAGDGFAEKTLATLAKKSPTSVAIAHEQMRRGRDLDFAEAMRTEFRIVSRIGHGHDFYEGVRAVVIDKDQAPRWRPATLDAVEPADIDAYFAPPPGGELTLKG